MKRILIATRNKGKFAEFMGILKGLPFKFLFLDGLVDKISLEFDVKETGDTFEKNAALKAEIYGKKANLLTLADDTGLCVDYLDGGPGVGTHRWAPGSDKDRYLKLLKVMKEVPRRKRGAKFVSVVALFDPQSKKVVTTKGECDGLIALSPKGKHGFGYDPVFIVKGLNKHFAQLTLSEKNQVSHRAKALKKMRKVLLNYLNED